MDTLYLVCAVVGATLLLCQLLLTLLGLGWHHDLFGHELAGIGHHDVQHEAQTSWLVSVLTFRTIVAALLFFGLAGLAAAEEGMEPPLTLTVALAAGAGALFLVAWLMRALQNFTADGTVHIERSLGRSGTVYVTVPGRKTGAGKVTLTLQNRTMEYQAVTAEEELPTGAKVIVVALVSPDTVEVALANPVETITHV